MKFSDIVILLIVMGLTSELIAQPVEFSMTEAFSNRDKKAGVRVEVSEFKGVLAFQGSLEWDVVNLKLDSISFFDLDGLSESSFSFASDVGILSFAWDEPNAKPITFEEKLKPIFTLHFTVNGDIGNEFNIDLNNSTTPWVVIQNVDGLAEELVPDLVPGKISIIEPLNNAMVDIVQPSCSGYDDGEIFIFPEGGLGGYTYEWSENVSSIESALGLSFGEYSVTITDALLDTFSLNISLNDPEQISIDNFNISEVTCEDSVGVISFIANGGTGSLDYYVNSVLIDDSSVELFIGDYKLNVIDELGCEIDTTFLVSLDAECQVIVFARNVLTPNGDGINDVLDFGNLDDFNLIGLTVFNRWGIQLYNNLQYENDWDGKVKGEYLKSGDYYYILRLDSEMVKSTLSIINEKR